MAETICRRPCAVNQLQPAAYTEFSIFKEKHASLPTDGSVMYCSLAVRYNYLHQTRYVLAGVGLSVSNFT